MAELSERFSDSLGGFGAVADAIAPEQAARTLDDATLQVFWREWPHLSSWAGRLWRLLNEDLEAPAAPAAEPDLDELGAGG